MKGGKYDLLYNIRAAGESEIESRRQKFRKEKISLTIIIITLKI